MLLRYHRRFNDFPLFVLIVFLIFILIFGAPQNIKCPIQSLYQFGDSFSDTGNYVRIAPNGTGSHLPYGETFPGYATGRFSDGLLIVDHIAMAVGLPFLNPYLDKGASFANGVNFAVAGGTALNLSFYSDRGIFVPKVPPLSVQLGWFREYLNSTTSSPTDKLRDSLVFVGESGSVDIINTVLDGRPLNEIHTFLPFVAQAVINATREVIRRGFSQVVVPGSYPLGCFPFALKKLPSTDPTSYDDFGCLKGVNALTISLNNQLQNALISLRNEFPTVLILYADYYNAFTTLLRNATALGLNSTTLLKPCCGDGDPFLCGSPSVPTCPNPNTYINWDGVHLTHAANLHISHIIINNLIIKCGSGSPTSSPVPT